MQNVDPNFTSADVEPFWGFVIPTIPVWKEHLFN